ncbi:MAG: hypothetical protein ABR577_09520 [Pyrinomonadaceae bacterium]
MASVNNDNGALPASFSGNFPMRHVASVHAAKPLLIVREFRFDAVKA